MTVRLFRDPLFLQHDAGPGHPESPRRLRAVLESLDRDPIDGVEAREPREATNEEILRVHDADHLGRVAATEGRRRSRLDPDTATCSVSYRVALRAAGSVVAAVEDVLRGEAEGACALVRPPGHHAEAGEAMGFCLFNNVAIGAAHAIEAFGLSRVLVLDPDVHHGNGTQHIFESRKDVLFVSSHRYPFFPGTGWFDEIGLEDGVGYTVNLPMPPLLGDADFVHLYREVVEPIVDEYAPELILVSAGFDTWKDDPIGMMAMTETGYDALFRLFRSWSDRHCPGRIVAVLEGGYDPRGVVVGIRSALRALTGTTAEPGELEEEASESAFAIAENARRVLSPHWSSLRA